MTHVRGLPDRAARRVRWSAEPEMWRWMDEHDQGQAAAELSRGFEGRFGFPLSRSQVQTWRSEAGRTTRPGRRGGGHAVRPVGYEREDKDGYLLVKVAEKPTRPQSKDNWRLKQVHVWEQAHGQLPDGHVVMFADHDTRNFAPENLVAVPLRCVAIVNNMGPGAYHDAESLNACLARAELAIGIHDAEMRLPRRCGVCGREFVPEERYRDTRPGVQTCPDCLALGLRARGQRHARDAATKVCEVCGVIYEPETARQRRCPDCVRARPGWGVERHARWYKLHGER